MSAVFLLSVLLKGIGALLEIFLQIFITRETGLSGYGSYSAWINWADLIFWVFFSGLVKCNTYYLSGNTASIWQYRKKYYFQYVIPALTIAATITCCCRKNPLYAAIFLIAGMEVLVLDKSSTMVAKGKPVRSLVGEYIIGRIVLLIGVILMKNTLGVTHKGLVILYMIQYLIVILFFCIKGEIIEKTTIDISYKVSREKWLNYQRADVVQSMIGQMPIIIQFLFSGAFEAGVVSIVLLVKKVINFITGPTAKIFLPEFSRLYKEEKMMEMQQCFASIMRIQMIFAGPLFVVLIGFPHVVLRILAEELLSYRNLFVICSCVFIMGATLGPCGGLMQMTGNEKKDNRYREIALLAMCVVMVIFRKDRLFVLYGLCVQTTIEAIGKYIFVCYWMKTLPVKIITYIRWWVLPVLIVVNIHLLKLQESFIAMVISAGVVFVVKTMKEVQNGTIFLEIKRGR